MDNATLVTNTSTNITAGTSTTIANDSNYEDPLDVRARQNVVLCILGLIFNAALLTIIIASLRLRRSAKYQLITSLSLANSLCSTIYLPLDTAMAFNQGVWPYGCGVLFFAYGVQEFVLPTITSLTLSALCVEYILAMTVDVTPTTRKKTVVIGVVLPWLVGVSALVPVYVLSFVTASGSFVPPCVAELWHPAVLVYLVGLFGYLPLAVVAASALLALTCRCLCRPPEDRRASRLLVSRAQGMYLTHEMADTFLACLVVLGFHLPFLLHFSMHVRCQVDGQVACASGESVPHVLEVVRTTGSVLFPAVWLLGMELRHGLFTSGDCCYRYCDLEVEQAITP